MAKAIRSDKGVAALKAPKANTSLTAVANVPGLFVRVTAAGRKSFVVVAKNPSGKQVWKKLDTTAMTIEEAQEKARTILKQIKAGESTAPAESFAAVAKGWIKRHVDKKGLRSKHVIEQVLRSHILPEWRDLAFKSIRRGHVAALLDKVEDGAGARAADYVLSVVSGICNWYATRNDDYSSPIVRGMRRTNPKARERKRTLNYDEIRALWENTENDRFGAFVRMLLLTGQRRDAVASMRWQDIAIDGTWTMPTEDRAKGTGGELLLPEIAVDIIKAQPRFANNPYVFAGRGVSYLTGYSKAKKALDAKAKIKPWTLHDLRRTARSLMSRAGVPGEIAERVLGHAIQGVEGVYNRHDYRDEKAGALRSSPD